MLGISILYVSVLLFISAIFTFVDSVRDREQVDVGCILLVTYKLGFKFGVICFHSSVQIHGAGAVSFPEMESK